MGYRSYKGQIYSRASISSARLAKKDRLANKSKKYILSHDIEAMLEVWLMLREGAIRWLGEIGRQY